MDKPARIKVMKTKLEVCVDSGHVASQKDLGEAWMVLCACGEYTWEDGNFCIMCGVKLKADKDDGWLCRCGHWEDSGLHCSICSIEPPQGCPCSGCQDGPHIEDPDLPDDVDF
jgi:CDGSH-type Zn-finger protein